MIAQNLTFVATVGTALLVVRSRASVCQTTLGPAWSWAVIAACSWCVAAGGAAFAPDRVAGQLWYVAAVLTLCPWIAVLGARRPTVRVWNWFVVLPLLAVLLWPVALCWMPRGPDRLTLATPHLIGFALVLLMGTGNYLATRFWILAAITCLAEALLVLGIASESGPGGRVLLIGISAVVLFQGVLSAVAVAGRRPQTPRGWNGLWSDFRNTFGIVWANRIAERINAEAAKGGWSVRLQPGGFVAAESGEPAEPAENVAQVEHTVRWLLRRFVDEEWIAARAPAHAAPGVKEGGSLAGNESIEASSTPS